MCSASATTQQPGSITPNNANSVIVIALGFLDVDIGTGATIDSGFTLTDSHSDAVTEFIAMAYKVQTTAVAVNPTWTSHTGGAADTIAATQAAFKHS